MAHQIASLFGSVRDLVLCPYYFKIGACPNGDSCSKIHREQRINPTLLLTNLYLSLDMITPDYDSHKIQQHFEQFYEDLFEELSKYGEIENLHVCDNQTDHMVGNVYVQFREEQQAANALRHLTGKFYDGRPIIASFSPVTDFNVATCKQYEESSCSHGEFCNFIHPKRISRELRRKLFGRSHRRLRRSGSRSRSYDDRSHRSHSKRYDDRDHYYESRSTRHRRTSPVPREGRSRSRSYNDCSHRSHSKRYVDRDHYYESRSRRHRRISPAHREGRSRSRSYDNCSRRSHSKMYDDRDHYYESRSKRDRNTSPHQKERSRSPVGLCKTGLLQEGNEERYARMQNWKNEEAGLARNSTAEALDHENNNDNNVDMHTNTSQTGDRPRFQCR